MGQRIGFAALGGTLLALASVTAGAQAPHFAAGEIRPALIVDGEPFLVLGAQAHNSSNYPAMLEQVWPAVEAIGRWNGDQIDYGFNFGTEPVWLMIEMGIYE